MLVKKTQINAAKNNTYNVESINIENKCLLVITLLFITINDIILLYKTGIKYFILLKSEKNIFAIITPINNIIGIIAVIIANLSESI